MYFIWYIIIGIIAGFVAGKLMRGGGFGLFINLLVGIVGGVLVTMVELWVAKSNFLLTMTTVMSK